MNVVVIAPSPRGEGAGGGVKRRPLTFHNVTVGANVPAPSITPPLGPLPSRGGEGTQQ